MVVAMMVMMKMMLMVMMIMTTMMMMVMVTMDWEDPDIDKGWMESIVRQLSIFDMEPTTQLSPSQDNRHHNRQQN